MSKVWIATAAFLLTVGPARARAMPNQLPAPAPAPAAKAQEAATTSDEELRRLTDSVLMVMERERVIARSLREAAMRAPSDSLARVRRAHVEELEAINLHKMRLESRLAAWCRRSVQPEGWMGISFSGDYRVVGQTPLKLRFVAYPRIEAVEPASPAYRAGLEIGDSIVAFDGNDLRTGAVSFSALLRPGAILRTTVRRDGQTRTLRMQVVRRPAHGESQCGQVNSAIAAAMANPVIDVIRLDDGYRYRIETPAGSSPMVAPHATRPAHPPEAVVAPIAPRIWLNSGSSSRLLAGMEVVLAEREMLQETFGASNGVLVLRVSQGSPARQSGLRAGDVIVSANGDRILSPIGLEKAMIAAGDDSELKLGIVRKRKPATMYLRWGTGRD